MALGRPKSPHASHDATSVSKLPRAGNPAIQTTDTVPSYGY